MDFVVTLHIFGLVLFIWSILNILISVISRKGKLPKGSIAFFYWEMNGLWNVINLLIVITSTVLLLIFNGEVSNSLSVQSIISFVIAINVALDVGYICFGYWLKRGKKKHLKTPSSRQIGYGKSLIVQGLFLLCFDAILSQTLFWLT